VGQWPALRAIFELASHARPISVFRIFWEIDLHLPKFQNGDRSISSTKYARQSERSATHAQNGFLSFERRKSALQAGSKGGFQLRRNLRDVFIARTLCRYGQIRAMDHLQFMNKMEVNRGIVRAPI
jgi:hypothetical protein